MKEQATICVAYTGEAVNDGTMEVSELAPALLALSNFIGEANRVLNNDGSTIEVRVSAHFERGSFEMSLEFVRTLAQQLKLFFSETSYSLTDILTALGLVATLSGCNFLELYRWLKGKQPTKVEKGDEDTVRVYLEEESREITIGVWKLFKSEKVKKHIAGIVHPLKTDGVDAVEFRDAENKTVAEKIPSDEVEYFSAPAQGEELQELISEQQLMLKIVNLSFDRDLTWRFDDGETKFYARVTDEKFLDLIESGRLTFSSGDGIVAMVETKQQHVDGEIKKTTKTIVKVLQINKCAGQINLVTDDKKE